MVFTLLTRRGLSFLFCSCRKGAMAHQPILAHCWLDWLVCTAVLLLIRLWPIFANPTTLGQMIEAKYAADVGQTDLRSLVTPSHFNPIFAQFAEPISETVRNQRAVACLPGCCPAAADAHRLHTSSQMARGCSVVWHGFTLSTFCLGAYIARCWHAVRRFCAPCQLPGLVPAHPCRRST